MKKIIGIALFSLLSLNVFAKDTLYNWVETQTGTIEELKFKNDNPKENDAIKAMLKKNLNSHQTTSCSTEQDYFKTTIESLDGCLISDQKESKNSLSLKAVCEEDQQNINLKLDKKNSNLFVGHSIVTSDNEQFSLIAKTRIEVKKSGTCQK